MMNPLRELRLTRGMTQLQVAEEAGMTKGAVLKYEQGLYEVPSVKLINLLATNPDEVMHIIKNYPKFRLQSRANAARIFGGGQNVPLSEKHPLRGFIEHKGLTVQGFCVLLCLHPAVVNKYLKGEQRLLPKEIQEALTQAKMAKGSISALHTFGKYYYDRLKEVKTHSSV